MESAKNRCKTAVVCAALAALMMGLLGMGGVHAAWAAGEGTVSEVYVSQQDGDDANMGGADDPVKTFERAKALLVKDGGTIYLSNYSVSGTQSWDLKGYTNACVKRMPSREAGQVAVGGHLISLEAGADLTLSDIVVDGWGDSADEAASGRDGLIGSVSNDTSTKLTLENGCVLQNNRSSQMGGAVEGYGLNLTMDEGSLIQNCSLYNIEYGGGVFIANNGTFTMDGGTISNCSANRGGGVAVIAAHMVMNDGKIENNSTYVAGKQPGYAGGIYLADYQEMSSVGGDDKRPNSIPARDTDFIMNGGTISGNSAHVYGGAICTFPQGGKHVSVEINDGSVSNNQVPDGSGGGIAAFFNTSKLSIKGGSIVDNSALNFGGGIFVYSMKGDKATMASGEITRNSAGYGGGIFLDASEFEQSDGCVGSNKALLMGGGYFINENSTLQLSNGAQVADNGPVSTDRHPSIDGDGIYVEGALKIADSVNVSTDNDVYLPEGKYIEVNRKFEGASQDEPISITSEKYDVEDSAAVKIGTKLVKYDDEAGADTAADRADENHLFVPSSKMPEGLHIGDSHVEGDWMTYMPCFTVAYQWVGDEQPTSVQPPAATTVERDEPYSAAVQDAAPGWIFDGWYTDEGCSSKYVNGSLILADTVLYGKWTKTTPATPLKACVSYVFVGQVPSGVQVPSYDMIDSGSSYTAKAQAGLEGWGFSGWCTNKDCTQRFVDGSTVSGNMVLYGTWSKVEKPQPGGSEVNPPSNDDSTEVVKPNPDVPQAPATPSGQETASNQSAQSGASQFARTSDPLPIAGIGLTLLALTCAAVLAIAARKLRS